MQYRICKTCKRRLPIDDFPTNGMYKHPFPHESKRGECRSCYNFRMKLYMRRKRRAKTLSRLVV